MTSALGVGVRLGVAVRYGVSELLVVLGMELGAQAVIINVQVNSRLRIR